MDIEWYKQWFDSPYYHKLYFERDEHEAERFINKLIAHLAAIPEARILDVACGRGRHARMLARFGFDVTGIDLSFDSIKYAQQFESSNLHFYQHDMRLPAWINYFDYAFNFFTSFGYFNTRREHEDAIQTIVKSLKKQGYLLIDYLNIHYAEARLTAEETKQIDTTNYEIHRWMDEKSFYKKIIVSDPELPSSVSFTEKVAKLNLRDFTDMLAYQNMQITEVFGGYDLSPYHINNSPRLILLARKKA